ncbi:MAG: MFS transporter [Candidatus Dormibacteraeota bacterium]|nr:MFS transporter [Candidatus Dormibacteraeota bacterium]
MSVALRSFVSVLRNPGLRRLQLAWGLWVTVDWACTVAISVFAFSQGGPAAVGLLNLVRMLVAAITAPFTSGLGDRLPRRRLLVLVEVTLALILACCAAAILFHLPGAIVYALAVAFTIAAAPFRALQGALLPRLAQTPNELTASNLVGSTMEGAGTLIGPVLAGSLLVLGRPAGVFGVIAALSVVAALLVNGIATSPSVRLRPAPRSILAEATAGFATLARERDVRFLVSLFSAQTLVRGALNVLIVVVAVDTLHFGAGASACCSPPWAPEGS